MSKQQELQNHYDRLLRKKRSSDPLAQKIPPSCKTCEYYRPEFKYRFCLFARCPYEKYRRVLRRRPLDRDKFSGSEVVKMRV